MTKTGVRAGLGGKLELIGKSGVGWEKWGHGSIIIIIIIIRLYNTKTQVWGHQKNTTDAGLKGSSTPRMRPPDKQYIKIIHKNSLLI